jgi:hypothetical protein
MYDDKAYSPDTAAETKRDGEVSRQLKLLSHEIKDCLSRSGTLVERLAAIVSPRAEPSQLEADKPSGPTTPFAANLADLTAQLRQAQSQPLTSSWWARTLVEPKAPPKRDASV